jgi:hypothetical protein
MESPLSKVTAIISERETEAAFEAMIASMTNQLVRNRGSVEDRA